MAEELGIKKYLRVASLNYEGHFIKGLVNLCKNANDDKSDDSDSQKPIFAGMEKFRICPKKFKFCPNTNSCKS